MAEPQGPGREMYWHERNSEQKIAKLADTVQYLSARLIEATELLEKLKLHDHVNGKIVSPLLSEDRNSFFAPYVLRNPLGIGPAPTTEQL